MSSTKLSSKGQIVIPAEVREQMDWKEGMTLNVQKTPYGIFLVPVPKKPLKSLKGILKGTGIRSDEVKEMRQREEE